MTIAGLRYWAMTLAIVMPGENAIRPTIEALNDPDIGTALAPAWDPQTATDAERTKP